MPDHAKVLLHKCWPTAGLGHVLISVLNCAYAAHGAGRALALDMREFRYFKSRKQERFFENFVLSCPKELLIISDTDKIDRLMGDGDKKHIDPPITLSSILEEDANVIIVDGYPINQIYNMTNKLNPPAFQIRLTQPAMEFAGLNTAGVRHGDEYIIGLYMRAANGEPIGYRFSPLTFPDYELRYTNIVERFADLARLNRMMNSHHECFVRVFSDSSDFYERIMKFVPDAQMGYEKRQSENTWQMNVDMAEEENFSTTLHDLWSLSHCDFLIYSESFFAEFAALNSPRLTSSTVFEMNIPIFPHLLLSQPTDEALRLCRKTLFQNYRHGHRNVLALKDAMIMCINRSMHMLENKAQLRDLEYERELLEDDRFKQTMLWGPLKTKSFVYAGEILLQAAETAPENPFYYRHAAALFGEGGDVPRSESALRAAIKIRGHIAEFHWALALLCQRDNRIADAVACFDRALVLDPENTLIADDLLSLRTIVAQGAAPDLIPRKTDGSFMNFALAFGDLA